MTWHCIPETRPAAGVFDGHRGPEAADYAAQHFAAFLRAQWAKVATPELALRKAFMSLDEAFRQQQVVLIP